MDHPRSRGVYKSTVLNIVQQLGSSPLARGLLPVGCDPIEESRIIPARAGFTQPSRVAWRMMSDHPRSRGVYTSVSSFPADAAGSSPLARGLQQHETRQADLRGIIPARAGFTSEFGEANGETGDHPRSRGVYNIYVNTAVRDCGSSPLARGLLATGMPLHPLNRIIPARAGFTEGTIPPT